MVDFNSTRPGRLNKKISLAETKPFRSLFYLAWAGAEFQNINSQLPFTADFFPNMKIPIVFTDGLLTLSVLIR